MTTRLDTQNPENLIYQNDVLRIVVLGGIKLEGLDRMRATLKICLLESSVPPVRHNLDLYNDTQVDKLVRKTAERLEVGSSVVSSAVTELIEQLEAYRLEEQKKKRQTTLQAPALSLEERKKAISFLSKTNLLERTNKVIGQSGVIGEEANRLIMYLVFSSRKTDRPLHILSLGSSGTGKSHLQERVAELFPEEDRIEITTLSENAFYYFGQRELKHKLLLIEDLDGALHVLYPLRELQSKRRITKTIVIKNTSGETRSVNLIVEGPICTAGCTTREQVYEDNANRSFLIYLDESEQQDVRVMDYQRALSANKVDLDQEAGARELLKNCQRLLEPIKVVNPYAPYLKIPKEVFKPRRTNNHYLQFIEVVTFYHQFQREQKLDETSGEVYIETTIEDIREANGLLKGILLRKADSLSGACRNHFERLKLYLIGQSEQQFTNRQISSLFRIPLTTVKRYHLDLSQHGYLKKRKQVGTKAYIYEVVSFEEYARLQSSISTVLDKVLEGLQKKLETSPSAQ